MAPSSGELWGHHLMPSLMTIDCLLPSGVLVPLECNRDAALNDIKSELWKQASHFPLFDRLSRKDGYIFGAVTLDGKNEEFYDERRRLCDLRLFKPVLSLIEKEGDEEEKRLNNDLGLALGLPPGELDRISHKDPEALAFRRKLFQVCKESVEKREMGSSETRALYAYPPEIENSSQLPVSMRGKLEKGDIKVAIWSLSATREKQKYTVAVPSNAFPEQIVREAIFKRIRTSDNCRTAEEKRRVVDEHQQAYILKVAGCDQYLLHNCPITQYKYVRACMARNEIPQIMLMLKKGVLDHLPRSGALICPSYARELSVDVSSESSVNGSSSNSINLWRLDGQFKLTVTSAMYVNVKEAEQIIVRAGLYHGTEPLCPVQSTRPVSPSSPRWEQTLEFERMFLIDLPRATKLCLSICSIKPSRSTRGRNKAVTVDDNTIATSSLTSNAANNASSLLSWANVNLFDWKNRMLSGKFSINLWPVPRGMSDDLLHPLGVVGSNPDSGYMPALDLAFERFNKPVLFPSMDNFKELQSFLVSPSNLNACSDEEIREEDLTKEDWILLDDVTRRDPLAEISEQEKTTLWKLRNICCRRQPDILPRLLDAIKWNSREESARVYALLDKWQQVSPRTALELLDCKYADPVVRMKAVKWLHAISDEDLSQYLMQLVQTLKYEPYLDSQLASFLLRRSLANRKIGHYFFWHVRAELHQPLSLSSSLTFIRFGIILEAFCRGLGSVYLKRLMKQVGAIDKLTKLTDSLKERLGQESTKDLMRFVVDQMKQVDFSENLQLFESPLNPTIFLGQLDVNSCRVMDSAKKPLWIVWNNPDELADRLHNQHQHAIIFKNGDDLRQDMLTLQVIRIMDHIWHTEGLDMRMTPYTCLATGNQSGLIEVVRQAKTVYQIQRQAGKLAAFQIDSSQLYNWIKEHNRGTLQQAIETFTLSCAGYCVATFILGIGDRHPDNIMVKKDGQIFHIDFGHFLGHFKKKFGISRERVPFVLTEDFLVVISNGKQNARSSDEFRAFQELCGKAYLALRRHANLLITLFTMMLPCGIPELQSIADVGYLRRTLAVEKTEEEALQYFQSMFYDAYGGAWTTKLDWFFHSMKHGVG